MNFRSVDCSEFRVEFFKSPRLTLKQCEATSRIVEEDEKNCTCMSENEEDSEDEKTRFAQISHMH